MVAIIRLLLALFAAAPAIAAQSEPEPPPPRSSPVISVTEEALPRAGGILVFGGTRGVGLEIVKQLVARNERVTVLARAGSDTTALKALNTTFLSVVTGDALDPESLKQAFTTAPFRAVVSTLGGRGGDYRADDQGNRNVIDAAKNAGLSRFVLVTALGTGDSNANAPWYLRWFMKDYFIAKAAAETHLKASGFDYTIIRPGFLRDSDKAGDVKLVQGPAAYGGITRKELGKLVADSVEDTSTFKKVYAAVDAKRTGLWAMLTY